MRAISLSGVIDRPAEAQADPVMRELREASDFLLAIRPETSVGAAVVACRTFLAAMSRYRANLDRDFHDET